MKPISRIACAATAAAAWVTLLHADLPVSFNLSVDPTGVALQFDVASASPLESIGYPEFEGASDHDVQSATIASGAHRFVIYSKTGDPIASTGEVNIVFSPKLPVSNGAISITNVTASNASGEVVAATPNALPVLTQRVIRDYQSLELGSAINLGTAAYDLDGSIKSVKLLNGTTEVDASSNDPFALAWTPDASGAFPISVVAIDNLDQQSVFDLGVYRAFSQSEITDFEAFASIHFGSSADDTAFDADPLKNGIDNGFAYLLGLNPYAPKLSRLPASRLERTSTGIDLVLTFVRRSVAPGVDWKARSTTNLSDYEDVEASRISETDMQDGFHAVELRLPLDVDAGDPAFIDLEVNKTS